MRAVPLLAALPILVAASPLPLHHGMFVMADTACKDAPFAAMMSWDGIGLGDPHSHGCRARILSRSGRRYTFANSCINAGVGPAPRTTERVTMTVLSRDSYLIDATRYRRCSHGTD